MKRSPSITSKLPPVLGLAAVLAIWLIASEGGLVPEFMLPSPAQVGAALVSEFPTLLANASVTLQEAALGLGAGKWHMIRTVVLPSSIDGIVTGCILAIGRIVGESAALLFTAGMGMSMNDFFGSVSNFMHSSGSSLTVALYVYARERAEFDVAFAIAAILMLLTLIINLAASLVGRKLKKK